MILGFDHLAWSVSDTDAAARELAGRGYRSTFDERGAANNAAKHGLLDVYRPTHDLALYRADDGRPAIEVTNHGAVSSHTTGPYRIVGTEIALDTLDVQVEETFWCHMLAFRRVEAGHITLKRPVVEWSCTIRLHAVNAPKRATLDSAGHCCLALLTNTLDRDLERATEAGATDATAIFAQPVNGRALRIALFRTPGGAIFELIEVEKK
ncbi:MAG: VOC family protein [Pyrinomonadaceae bacterium]